MRRHLTLATLGILFLAACENAVTVPAAPDSAPALAKAEKGSGSGATVIKEGVIINWLMGGDPRDQLALVVGIEPPLPDLCTGTDDPVGFSPARAQAVVTPAGRVPVYSFQREAYVEVYQYGGGIVTDGCQLVGAPVAATGRVRSMSTITDASAEFGDGIGGPGASTLHVTVQGVVDLTSGGQARLFGTVRVVIGPDGELLMDEERIRLTPL